MSILSEETEINVHIGEVKIGDSQTVLKAILGSCVGIGFIWRKAGKVALAHCLLPYGEDPVKKGKFVNQAIDSLLKILEVQNSQIREIEAVIAGGASMYEEIKVASLKIGDMNSKAVLECLREKKIHIIFQDLGLKHGRQLILSGVGEYKVRILESLKKD